MALFLKSQADRIHVIVKYFKQSVSIKFSVKVNHFDKTQFKLCKQLSKAAYMSTV